MTLGECTNKMKNFHKEEIMAFAAGLKPKEYATERTILKDALHELEGWWDLFREEHP
jgi:hypothetical protein